MCPACKEALVVFELDGVEIDRCLRCGGTWLDSGEFAQLLRLSPGAPDRLADALQKAPVKPGGRRRCVRCPSTLQEIAVGTVDIDRCPRGHGLWFDRNEMETLIAAHGGGDGGAMARFLDELHPSGHKKGD